MLIAATNQEVAGSSPAGRANCFNNFRDALRVLQLGVVSNGEQFAADPLDGVAQRPIQHLRVHIQRRVDVGLTRQLCDHFAGYPFVV